MVTAAVLTVEIVTEPAGAMVMFPAVPPDAAEVFSADAVGFETVRSSAKPTLENTVATAPDNKTLRIFKVTPAIPLPEEAIVSAS